jgi:hypothetical protein
MQPTTPIGSRTTIEVPTGSSKRYASAVAAAVLKLLIGRPTWTICDSHLAMPVSLEIVVASSSIRAPRASPMRERYLARSSTGVCDHDSNAALAALTARSTSAAVPAGIVAITSSVTESMTSMVSDESDGVNAPSMYSLSNVVMVAS